MADVNYEICRFLSWKSVELKTFLRDRSVPVNEEKHAELAEKAYLSEKLGLKVKSTNAEAEHEIEQAKGKKLVFDGGIIHLPRPESLTVGWEDGPSSLPDCTRDHLDSYVKAGNRRIGLEKTEGKRTLALGKGLHMSGHIRALQYHGISANLSYCFVWGKVIPQQKTGETAYNTWVVLQKETGQVCTAECSCIVGIQATCKHIAGLLFAVVEAVEEGRNVSSTSQKQAWGKAPNKGQSIHPPQFAKDIKVIGVKEDVSIQRVENTRVYRSDFDPRVKVYRAEKHISAFNLDKLASITNGNCSVLVHTKRACDANHQDPDITCFTTEETVETHIPAPTVKETYDSLRQQNESVSPEELIKHLTVSKHQQEVLAHETLKQASSSMWAAHRKGRITASVAGNCIGSVRDGSLSGHSQVAQVMGYYGSPQSAALTWGKKNEDIARKQYLAHHRLHHKHTGFSCIETGLWISLECPYVAASPDGILSCNQCGSGLLEIKNPYSNRHLSIKELSCQKGSFLTNENGVIQLKRTHSYYVQVQIQMWTSNHKWCDFVVRTISLTDNLFAERICFDFNYIVSVRPKLKLFLVRGIVPELATGAAAEAVRQRAVKRLMESMLDKLQQSNIFTSDRDYPCGICGDVCEDQPFNVEDNSICCDCCDRWFHYGCAGINGSERFLKKRMMSWKCAGCYPRKRKLNKNEQ